MTNTNQKIAMFAITAFALSGLGLAPAFADATVVFTENATGGSTDYYLKNTADACGTKAVISQLWISESNPGSEDSVKVKYDASRCGSFTDATINVTVAGNSYGTAFNDSDTIHTYIFGGSISPNDQVIVTIVYDVN